MLLSYHSYRKKVKFSGFAQVNDAREHNLKNIEMINRRIYAGVSPSFPIRINLPV
jgi:hypothetical protein